MTRPASFNKIWADKVDPSQYADETTSETQGFMNSGWEGGSDKKAPLAKTQNYMMKKHDLAMQEIERQGFLSWRSDVPYAKGARVFYSGSIFHALQDNTNVQPQGANDTHVWYLVPTQSYPSNYEIISGIKSAAQHAAEDFEPRGSADALKNNLKKIAFSGNVYDTDGSFPWGRLSNIPGWISGSHEDGGTLYLRSTNGTQFRIGNGYFDFLDINSNPVFTVNPSGYLTAGTIPAARISGLKTGAAADVYDTNYGTSYKDLPFSGAGQVPSTGAMNNILSKLYNDIESALKAGATADVYDTGYGPSYKDLPFSGKNQIPSTGAMNNILSKLYNDIEGGLGEAARKGFFDTGDPEQIPYGGSAAASTGCVASVYAKHKGVGYVNSTGEGSGWIKFPSGTIMQFTVGYFQGPGTRQDIKFPIVFPNHCHMAMVSTDCDIKGTSGDTWYQTDRWDVVGTSVYAQATGASDNNVRPVVFAIGY